MFNFAVDACGFLAHQYQGMYYLLKSEPSVYSFADLQREASTVWDGVTNPAAVKNLREMKPGDQLVIYHTGDEKRTVGTATVVSVNAADPKTPLVKIKSGKPLPSAITLAEMKSNPRFKDSPLLRQSRLSVVPLTEAQHNFLLGK
jgi:predicted RNA-binding protein with PUA-like domain